jgi:hypothetical protein
MKMFLMREFLTELVRRMVIGLAVIGASTVAILFGMVALAMFVK